LYDRLFAGDAEARGKPARELFRLSSKPRPLDRESREQLGSEAERKRLGEIAGEICEPQEARSCRLQALLDTSVAAVTSEGALDRLDLFGD
jgi:hypothetical protein